MCSIGSKDWDGHLQTFKSSKWRHYVYIPRSNTVVRQLLSVTSVEIWENTTHVEISALKSTDRDTRFGTQLVSFITLQCWASESRIYIVPLLLLRWLHHQTTPVPPDTCNERALTFLASHSCLGRGLLTPIRLSSVDREGKEKTAEREGTTSANHVPTKQTSWRQPNTSLLWCNSPFPEPSTSASLTLAGRRHPPQPHTGREGGRKRGMIDGRRREEGESNIREWF